MAWSTPLEMMANVVDSVQQDPQASKIMLGVGLAHDMVANAPIDLFSNIPHFEFEVDSRDAADLFRSTG